MKIILAFQFGIYHYEIYYKINYFIKMKLNKLKEKLEKIEKIGFIKTHRAGDTGIGKTLEDLLGIKENNIPLPDIDGVAELKACRKNTKSMMTLFTLEPLPRGGDRDRFLLDNFGYSKRGNKRSKELHITLSSEKYNKQGLKLSVEKDKIRIKAKDRKLKIYWDIESVQKKFYDKLPALVYVSADKKIIGKKEYFCFNNAYFLTVFSFELFKKMVRNNEIFVDLRMYYKPNGSVRNHGTAFRIKRNKLYNCFKNKVKLI